MIKANDIHQESIFPFRECGAAHVPLTTVMIVNRSRTCRHGGYKKERTTNIVSAAFWEPAPISAAIGDCGQLCLLFGGAKMMSPVQLCFGRREKAIRFRIQVEAHLSVCLKKSNYGLAKK